MALDLAGEPHDEAEGPEDVPHEEVGPQHEADRPVAGADDGLQVLDEKAILACDLNSLELVRGSGGERGSGIQDNPKTTRSGIVSIVGNFHFHCFCSSMSRNIMSPQASASSVISRRNSGMELPLPLNHVGKYLAM